MANPDRVVELGVSQTDRYWAMRRDLEALTKEMAKSMSAELESMATRCEVVSQMPDAPREVRAALASLAHQTRGVIRLVNGAK